MNFSSYFVLSTLVVMGIVAHAYVAHEQFYPAVVYLSTDKMCLAVMYNFSFALFLLFGKVLLRVFIGTLRDLEVEQLVDSGRGFLADTILFLVFYAPTIDNQEVGTVYLIQYICCVIFMKVFHLTTQIRVSHMFEVGVPRLIVNIKLVALMLFLLSFDLVACQYFYSVASRSSTFFTWILFEALTMATVVLVSIFKYSVHMVDLRLDSGWPGKSVCLFYIDLVHDVVSMTLFLVFMLTFFVQNPSRLPIYMMADVIQVARKLAQRLRSFRRYRRISVNMEMRFPDATDEEIEQNEHCVICRESLFEASKPKKLPCGHIFHIDCLRSWLVMQQVCPTCRAEIPADGPLAAPVAAPNAAAERAAADRQAAAERVHAALEQQERRIVDGAYAQAAAATAAAAPAAAPPQPQVQAQAPSGPAPVERSATLAYTDSRFQTPTAPTAASSAAVVAPPVSTSAGSAAGTTTAPSLPQPGVINPVASAAPAGGSAASAASAPTTTVPQPAALKPGATAPVLPPQAPASAHHPPMPSLSGTEDPYLLQGLSASLNSMYAVPAPPIEDLMEALKRAEEVSKFLRQQTDFWMEQVRQIQSSQAREPSVAPTTAAPSAVPDSISTANRTVSAPVVGAAEAPSSPPGSQLAELRRLQQEQWQRRRSTDSLSENASTGNS